MSTQLTLRLSPADLQDLDAIAVSVAGPNAARHVGKTAAIRIAITDYLARRAPDAPAAAP